MSLREEERRIIVTLELDRAERTTSEFEWQQNDYRD